MSSRDRPPKEDREFITSLARGLSVIHAFDSDHPQLTLSEVGARTKLSPATARRCLWTLERLGYVGTRGRYFLLLPKVVSLGSAFLESARIEEIIQPILRDIVAEVGDSASLGVLEGDDVLYIANFSAKRLVRLTAGVGTRFPAYVVSMGRVLLAELSPQALDAYLQRAQFTKRTSATVTDPEVLRARIEEVRKLGYSAMLDELEEGLGAVAVPVRVRGRVVASLNCSAFSRSTDVSEMVAARLQALESAAQRVAEAIQHLPAIWPMLGRPLELSGSEPGAAEEA